MFKELETSIARLGIRLDAAKTEWSHNLAVSFEDVDQQVSALQAVRQSVVTESRDLKRQISKLHKLIKQSRGNACERRSDSGGVATDVMDAIDIMDIEYYKSLLTPLHARQAELISLLADNDRQCLQPDFTIAVAGEKVSYVHPRGAMQILGNMVSGGGKTTKDLEHRISKAWAAFLAEANAFE